jgi:hypothetical protein
MDKIATEPIGSTTQFTQLYPILKLDHMRPDHFDVVIHLAESSKFTETGDDGVAYIVEVYPLQHSLFIGSIFIIQLPPQSHALRGL